MSRTVTQNGQSVKIPLYKGKVNFAAGFRKALPANRLKAGGLVIRERDFDRTLVKVLEVGAGDTFQGVYVTRKGEPVTETPPRTFKASRWPLFNARPSR